MTSVFFESALILLREGLEAILVIAALAAYLQKTGGAGRVASLYWGAGMGVLASLGAAWAFEAFNAGMHNDVMEGVVIFVAAALMLFVSGWLAVRQDPRAWQAYLREQADRANTADTAGAVTLLSFFAVFREGAETVLFIHVLAGKGGWSAGLFGGILTAAFVLGVLFVLIEQAAKKLPLRAVFLVSSAFLFVMAIKFIGEGLQEFQEQLMVPSTAAPAGRVLEMLGLNPTWEALGVQGIVIVLAVSTWLLAQRRARGTRTSDLPAANAAK